MSTAKVQMGSSDVRNVMKKSFWFPVIVLLTSNRPAFCDQKTMS